MYKAKELSEVFLANRHQFNSDHHAVEKWIKSQNDPLARDLIKSHGYNRVVSLFDFDQLSRLEGFQSVNKLCVVSGSCNELETNFINVDKVFATSLDEGYDLTDNWEDSILDRGAIGSFDFVMCNQVLEHIPDPIQAFKNLVLMAKPGAYIWISLPVINRIHDEPNFYSSGYHPRYLRFLADQHHLNTIHIGAWGSLKYKLFAVSRNWPPYRKLKRGLRSNSDLLFPKGMFMDGRKLDSRHLVDAWGLFQKPKIG